jgi:ferrochelatase
MAVIRAGDAYASEVARAHEAVSARLGLRTSLAYQSQGADGGEWQGPTLRETLELLAKNGEKRVVIAPFGFLSDHVETLYDLDIETAAWCRELGLELTRVPALNADPLFIGALCDLASKALS